AQERNTSLAVAGRAPFCAYSSKEIFCSELDDAPWSRGCDLSNLSRRSQARAWVVELCPIEEIEKLEPQLYLPEPFTDRNVLIDGKIDVRCSWSNQHVSAEVPEAADPIGNECGWVEILVDDLRLAPSSR